MSRGRERTITINIAQIASTPEGKSELVSGFNAGEADVRFNKPDAEKYYDEIKTEVLTKHVKQGGLTNEQIGEISLRKLGYQWAIRGVSLDESLDILESVGTITAVLPPKPQVSQKNI
ncbi:MAG: hypothetical protein ACW99F_19165 [Candidatus Hodarchaeales archaeon]|jgi:hypothetical protein